jgi:hypothetical protein
MKQHSEYRVVKNKFGPFCFAEVYFDEGKLSCYRPISIPSSDALTGEEAIEEIRKEMAKIMSSLDKPVLTEGDFQ